MEKKWVIRFRLGVIIGAFLVTLISIVVFSKSIQTQIEKQTKMTLKDVANQNAITVERELTERQNFLLGMAKELQEHSGDSEEELLKIFRPYVEVYNFKRMGFVYKTGTVYTTDGYQRDLSFRDFFIKGMQGETVITGMMEDALGEKEDINVFSVPVYNKSKGNIEGVLFATYRTKNFEKLLNVECFEGEGYNLLVTEDGTIVSDSEKSPVFGKDNFLEAMAASQKKKNLQELQKMKENIAQNKSGNVDLIYKGEQYIYYTPIDNKMDEQWYMLTVVPAKTLQSRVEKLQHDIRILLLIIMVVLIFVTVVYSSSYGKDKKVLMRLAYCDPLTGGDNYPCFVEKMKSRDAAEMSEYLVALDLSEFKIINSTCGVLKGDEALQGVWKVLDNNLNRNEQAAHINADHFVLYLLADSKESIISRIEKISKEIRMLSEYLQIPDLVPYYGIYQIQDMEGVENGYTKANQAKHCVKGNRKDNYAFYEDIDFAKDLENKKLIDGFEEALTKHRFEVWYQPKYSTDDGVPVGAEALVRWRDKDGSLIPPFKFIPLFEKNGMIARLDEYVFEEVCRQQKQWLTEGKDILPISVNISRASLYYSNIVEKYVKIVEEHDLPICYVQLEITESATIENSEVKELIERFHNAGFQLLLDDFGNGYSSLATLNTLHFDVLKVDKSLIDYIGNADGEKLLKCIIGLAKSLGLQTTAEGVESVEQVRFLQDLQCNDIQGYYFSKPLPLEEFEAVLA